MVQVIIRATASLIFLGLAIYVHQFFPTSGFNNNLVIALLAFFVAEGPIFAIQKSSDRIDDDDARMTVVILSIFLQATAVLAGVIFVIFACKQL